jgi:succinate-semialdehyde dehydrogenase/glutarate-semialdehyde dehydrogenase
MANTSVNPATGETIRTYRQPGRDEIERAIQNSHRAFLQWRNSGFDQRSALMNRAAALLRRNRDGYARLMAEEMGKPLAQGRAEAEKCAWVCEYYAEHAARMLTDEPIATDASKSFVAFNPLGILLAIMPWNFPFWQVFRCAAPAIMAGNVVVLKHASNVPGCALAIEELFREAGFAEGVFSTLLVDSVNIADLIERELVRAVTVTGSVPAGQAIAARAGALLKKTVLELGGSDPYLILEDADVELAAETCVASRLINAGQSCIAAKRFIVVEPVRHEFEQRFIEKMRAHKTGDALDKDTQVGPLARRDLRDSLHELVRRSVEQGATLALGGVVPEGPGAYYPPTVLLNVRRGMAVCEQETFGPVAAVIGAANEDQAIEIANDSVFGLGAAVFTRDLQRGERIAAQRLEAGSCFVNAFVKSDPRLPFGGIKQSGYGRELSVFGIREFVNIKTVYVK